MPVPSKRHAKQYTVHGAHHFQVCGKHTHTHTDQAPTTASSILFAYRNPEVTAVRGFLEGQALNKLAATGQMRTFDDLCPSFRSRPMDGPCNDQHVSLGGGSMVQMEKPLRLSAEELKVLPAYLEGRKESEGLDPVLPEGTVCYRHTVANIRGEQMATSVAHKRSKSRVSSYVLVRLVSTAACNLVVFLLELLATPQDGSRHTKHVCACCRYDDVPFIGHVQYFLRLELPEDKAEGKAACTLRLAVCQYYAPQAAAASGAAAEPYSINLNKPCRSLEAEDIDCIDCVLCHGKFNEPGHGKRKRAAQNHVVHPRAADVDKVYLWRFNNLSRMA